VRPIAGAGGGVRFGAPAADGATMG
jgi:hypothetical protein